MNQPKFIIRNSGGDIIPTYLTETGSTCIMSDAFQFTSLQDAIDFGKAYLNGKQASIRDSITEKFVAWINY